jgi:dnd system-associated protein 4
MKLMKKGSDVNGPFETYADVLAFAAALAVKRRLTPEQVTDVAKEPYPVDYEVFISRRYEQLFDVIALFHVKKPSILSDDSKSERIKIFEEYANAGLGTLSDLLNGVTDYTQRLLLVLCSERDSIGDEGDVDVNALLGFSMMSD